MMTGGVSLVLMFHSLQLNSARYGRSLTRAALGLPDIVELIRSNIPIVFTCANDYADVKVSTPSLAFSPQVAISLRLRRTHTRSCSPCTYRAKV